ncbi:hypothetical protein SARC_00277 [Sphaeroforma arctica JP610]|uniref:Uncharacterized protein n=1 Tax=Sphaeroforma arctica JP610 TaxID=667725 RepID=A0A0L0GH43_9EUKA|nr:hypothetical protein SARC_00277 [Sphaeroforma arctica JP610]KNC87648.1 hypothetical protein SARC_00277 [Sphaeroforma arctica JP610]|eukprot:XP_014161550.1 hypothetical protein SARC_00277 [Sphaeroforma arctica JP610]
MEPGYHLTKQVGPINDQLTTNPTTTLTPRTAASKSPGFWQDHPEFEGRSTHSNQVLKRLKYFTTDPVAPFEESSPNNTPTRSTDVKPTLDLSRAEIASLSRFHRPVRFQFLSNIQTLTLAYNFLSDIKPLAGSLPALQVLDLSYNQLTYMDVETFASLPLLRWLSLDGNDFASSRLAFNPSGENQDRLVATVPSLQALSLRNNELQSIRVHGVSFARAFPNLQDLNVDSNSITTLDLRELRSLRAVSIANNLLGRSADPRSVDLHLADWAHECLWLPDTTERVVVDHNYLQSITGLLCLPNLKVLKASNNRLSFTGTREGSEANDTRAHAQGSIHSTLNERSPRRHFQFRLPNGTSPLRVLDLSNNHYSTLDFLTAQAKPFDAIDHSGTHPSRTHALAQTQAYSFHKLAVLLANNNRLERRECVLNIVQHLPELAYLDTRDNPFLLTTLFSAAKRSEMPVDGLTGTLRVSDTSKHPTHPRPYSDSPSRQGTHTLTHTHTREDTGLLYTGLASDLAVPFRDARIKLGERVVDARVAVTSSTVQIDKFISTLPVPQKQAFLQHRRDVRTLAHHGSTTKLQFLDGFIVLPGVEDKQLIAMNATSFTPSVPDHTQPPPKDQMRAHGSNQNGSLSAKIQPSAIATAKHSNTHSPSAQEGSEFPSLSKLARALASVKDPARAHGLSSMYATTVPTVATEANGRSNHGMHADAHNGSTLPQEGDVEHTKDSTGSTNRPQGSSPIDPNSGDVSFMKLPTLSSTAGDVGVTGPAGNGPDGVHNMPASLNLNRMHCESGRAKPELGMAMSSNATGLPERGTTWAASGQAQRIPAKECGTVGPGGPISFVHVSDANEPDTAQRLGGNSWNSPRVQTHSKLRETSTRSPSPISTNVYAPSSSHLATDTYTYTQPETAHPRTRLQPVPTAYGGQLRSTVPPSPPSDEQLLATLSSDSLRDAVRRFLGVTKSDSTRHTGNCMNHCTRVHADDMSHQRRANVHVSAAPSPLKTNNKTDASIYAHATTPSRPSAGSRSTYAYANGGPLGFTPESAGETPTTVGGDTPLHQETPASASGTVGTNYSPRANIEFEEDTPKANSGSNSRPRMSQQADAPHEGTGREGTGFKAPLRHRRDKRSDYAEDTDTINAASGRERNRNSGMNSGTRMSPASAGYDNEALEMELEYTDDSDTRGSSGTRRRPHRRDSNPPSNTDEDRRVRNSPRREGKRRTGQAVISAERVDSSVAVAGEKGWPHVPAGFGRSATLIKSYMQDSNTIDATTRRRESSLLELESVLDIHDPRLQSNGRYIGRSNKKKDYSAAPSRLNQDKIKSSRGTRRGPIQPLNDHSQQTLYNQAHARDYDQDSNNLGTRDNPQGRQRSGRQSVVFHDDVEMLGSPRTSNGGGSHSMSDELLYSSRVLHNRPHMTQIRPVTSPAPQMRSAIYRGRNTGVGYGYTQTRGTSTAAKMDSGRNTGDSQKADIVVPQCTDSSRLLKMMRRLSAELGSDQQQSGPPPVNAVVKGGSYECDTVRGYIEDMCKCTPSVMKSYNDVLNIRITQLTRTFSPDRLERFERIGGGTSEFLNDLGSSSGVGASQSKLHALIYADTGKTLARLVKHGFSVRSSTTAPLILEAGVSRAVSFAQQNNSRGTVSCLLVLANLGMCCTNFSGDYKDFMQSWETQTVELLTKGYDSVRLAIRADARGPRGDTAYVYVLFSHFRLAAIYSCIFTLQ